MSKKEKPITRKDFIKKSYSGLTGLFAYNTLKNSPLNLFNSGGQSFETRTLGRTGIKVSPVGFGAARTMEPSLLRAAVDHGMNFIDTGRSYARGNNEIMVGKVLKDIRKDIVIQSKIKVSVTGRNRVARSSGTIMRNMESMLNASLKALQTDYIDIMLIHDVTDLNMMTNDTVMEFLSAAKKKGQIRAHGFSAHGEIEFLQSANETLFYDILMMPFNHRGAYKHVLTGEVREWDQPRVETEMQKAHKNNLGIVTMKSCSAGPYSPSEDGKPSFSEAIKWVINHNFIHVAAVAMSNIQEIRENVRIMIV
ncbi:aldo/keto reductase [candidate division KSB1 bacterium]